MKQAILDRVRVMNKRFTNKILIRICGKRFGHFAILGHTGRRTGRFYRIPVIAEPLGDGFVIALTYGRKVDWYANIRARGTAYLFWKERDYALVQPEFVDRELGLSAYPPFVRLALRGAGIRDFLKLTIQPQE